MAHSSNDLSAPTTPDRATWRVGQRVSRKDTAERGTVMECGGQIKVKWDGGKTSYFRKGDEANVRLITKQ